MQVTKDDIVTLELLMDRTSLSAILEALSLICREKAEHIHSNWSDAQTAKFWERDAAKIDRCIKSIEN